MRTYLLLMLAALAILVFGFGRLILSVRQIRQFIQNIKSKKTP